MNRFLGIVLFLTFSLSLFGRDISGVVDSDGKGLKNVVVTDGFNFIQTNENGVLRGTGLLPKREYLTARNYLSIQWQTCPCPLQLFSTDILELKTIYQHKI